MQELQSFCSPISHWISRHSTELLEPTTEACSSEGEGHQCQFITQTTSVDPCSKPEHSNAISSSFSVSGKLGQT